MTRWQFLLAMACVLSDTVEHVLYRMAGHHPKRYFAFVAPAVGLYVLTLLCWLRLLNGAKLGLAIPFMALSHVTVALAGRVLFRERVDAKRWGGILLVIAGVALLGYEG